ncbi:MAG: amino acid ABC transporter permease, partial [Actinobacteria bacterium]|nr:amino acid ABC transporter permease [Actinomycetota bacterium]
MATHVPVANSTDSGIPPELRIRAARARHPWRGVFAVILLLLVFMFIADASGRKAYDWAAFRQYLFDPRIVQASGVTLQLTVYSMIIAVLLGVLLA